MLLRVAGRHLLQTKSEEPIEIKGPRDCLRRQFRQKSESEYNLGLLKKYTIVNQLMLALWCSATWGHASAHAVGLELISACASAPAHCLLQGLGRNCIQLSVDKLCKVSCFIGA